MSRYWVLIGEYDSETTAYTACAGSAQTSPYTPSSSGTIVGLRTIVGGGAATSLVNHVQFKLTCALFQPNSVEVGAQGSGLQTAPAVKTGEIIDWVMDQPISAGVPITVEGRNVNAETPVTVDVMLYACIEG